MLKLLGNKEGQEYIQALKELTLDDLYKMARQLGKVEIGGSFISAESAEIRCNFTGNDFVNLKCSKYPDVKQNLAEVIDRATRLKDFYAAQNR